ncbi:LptF/LptG family permease [Desulfurispirillum indicum]|uniref:Permease YjgP/YjgQ family protein n=1 Tax=Desulfurispirillum indicum (strain ATCC BAA-1389 / DSM 22839 / S5) TaxID=653733 RepID=E6W1K8_DESIS|nr:LptF/LptG family permease [Desulfurispirillum indicum]ADU66557.1 permease YjgP/YjgQ family protein [Desulfurispirillum indicum S5]UCZ55878.1 LptF/LptG family permease [Desulfurispirillum indicum]
MTLLLYTFRQYLHIIFLAMAVLVALYGVVDIIGNLDDFAHLSSLQIAYYVGATLLIGLYHLTPAIMLIATVMYITTIGVNNEMKIMLSAGISLKKISLPVLVFVSCAAGAHFLLGEQVFQHIKPEVDALQKYEARQQRPPSAIIAGNLWVRNYDGTSFARIRRFNMENNLLLGVEIYTVREGMIQEYVSADHGSLQEGRIHLEGVVIRNFMTQQVSRLPEHQVEFTGIMESTKASIKPLEEYSSRELASDIAILREAGHPSHLYVSELLRRVSYSLAIIVLSLVAIPLGVTGERKSGKIFSVTVGLLVAMVYFIVDSLAMTLGKGDAISPYIAPFIANGVFLGLFVFLYSRHRNIV